VIQASWADLQQLPTAWEPVKTSNSPSAAPSSIVEFGSLAEEPSFGTKAEVVEPAVELDEKPSPSVVAPPSSPKAAARRPRALAGPAPEAVDPFAEPFEEEELVLDSFATLASIFGSRTPRVENSREPSIARMVQNALDAFSGNPSPDVDEKSAVALESSRARVESESAPPSIRLAVVEDGQPLPNAAAAFTTAEPDVPRSWKPAAAIESRPLESTLDDAADAILVIEDDVIDGGPSGPGVRRESYRQLFSRLRHGA
jgi:hypothetical protein